MSKVNSLQTLQMREYTRSFKEQRLAVQKAPSVLGVQVKQSKKVSKSGVIQFQRETLKHPPAILKGQTSAEAESVWGESSADIHQHFFPLELRVR